MLRLKKDIEEGLVDEELIELLKALNENEMLFTTSSCAGRITLGCSDDFLNNKVAANNVIVSHSPVSVDLVLNALKGMECKWSWLKASHPLLDIAVKDLDLALDLVGFAQRAGFKYSGIQRSRCCYRVIVRGSDNLQAPLTGNEDPKTVAKLVGTANRFLINGKLKLTKFVSILESEGVIDGLDELLLEDLFDSP
ncbi:hypothetical protein EYM_01900 [Ignicoccus islandicus DSM 13165]|uniref:tRNA(Phe) 7-((3-amino-3-carboxypropyl)-4-demethylwyosine(37)-N(4))-methyltransferase n=1 Tax=Ignicoccus islandicus DSM 13165 TaxID=940295 RepID=A0A0U3FK51_9CREN|nr:hypothetical protein [Ignicoccus islandicus]ALU12262.1 hypothetical protein EYM_01900 [Ignicoccus islandicus DSM 13165]